jgi:Flp pilus assembly protein TadB
MMNLVAVSSRRNAKMLRDWRKLQTRNSPRRKLSRFIMISILVIAIFTAVITALGGL